jgi:transcriptional regulator with XRE-family HTH domain
MKTKSFKDYLEKRLDKKEITQIKEHAEREVSILKSFQKTLTDMTNEYMKKNKVGFNELARLLDSSPSQLAKIQKGEANLRLSSVAHLFALMDKDPKDIFRK